MKRKLSAVYDEDLELFLKSIGEYYKIVESKKKCKICNETITLNNIHAIFPEAGDVKYVCDKKQCVIKYGSLEEK